MMLTITGNNIPEVLTTEKLFHTGVFAYYKYLMTEMMFGCLKSSISVLSAGR